VSTHVHLRRVLVIQCKFLMKGCLSVGASVILFWYDGHPVQYLLLHDHRPRQARRDLYCMPTGHIRRLSEVGRIRCCGAHQACDSERKCLEGGRSAFLPSEVLAMCGRGSEPRGRMRHCDGTGSLTHMVHMAYQNILQGDSRHQQSSLNEMISSSPK
jgi:hypothetical protein